MDAMNLFQILEDDVCISHSANSLGKGNNPNILLPRIGKLLNKVGCLTFYVYQSRS